MGPNFDYVVCVNLDRCPERWERFLEQMDRVGWPFGAIERVLAIDGLLLGPCPEGFWFKPKSQLGAWGCARSHIRIIEDALNGGVESLLIFEDDAVFAPDFNERWPLFCERLPADWDGLYLGGEHIDEPTPINEHVLRCKAVIHTHAWALRGRYIRDVYWWLSSYHAWARSPMNHIDHRLATFISSSEHKVYAPTRWLVGQDDSTSTISNKTFTEPRYWNPPDAQPAI